MKEEKTFNEVYDAWYRDKRNYVKQTTISSYVLTAENHLIPRFGEMTSISEQEVQDFVLEKLQEPSHGSKDPLGNFLYGSFDRNLHDHT